MVTLQHTSKHPADTYINANYIANPYNGDKKYFIATQGPIPKSMNNFWHMVWLEGVTVVVMLCGLQEHGRVRSALNRLLVMFTGLTMSCLLLLYSLANSSSLLAILINLMLSIGFEKSQ